MTKRILTLLTTWAMLSMNIAWAQTKSIDKVPSASFQGVWELVKHTVHLDHGKDPSPEEITEHKVTEGEVKSLHFRRHKSGAIQQFEPSKIPGEVSWSRGVTILDLTDTTLKWRRWSDHPAAYRKIRINKDGTAILTMFGSKFMHTYHLKNKNGEQVGARQPATAADSKREGTEKNEPASEDRSL